MANIPLFGGAAHGQWTEAVKHVGNSIERDGSEYFVHWVSTAAFAEPAPRDLALLWFGVTSDYVPALHFKEVVDAYAAEIRT